MRRRRRGKFAGGFIAGVIVFAAAVFGRRPEPTPERPEPVAQASPRVEATSTPPAAPAAPEATVEPATKGVPVWRVVSVHDGDTVLCLDQDNAKHKVRLQGIDAPEIGQAFGTVSRDGLRALVLRKSVTVHTDGQDRYGRTLGTLEIDSEDVNRQMVADGLAWHYKRYSRDATMAACRSV